MISRPRFRLPLWAALAIVMAAYALRSLLMRGGDFSPDLPGDAIVAIDSGGGRGLRRVLAAPRVARTPRR